jgi:hypothetical protein
MNNPMHKHLTLRRINLSSPSLGLDFRLERLKSEASLAVAFRFCQFFVMPAVGSFPSAVRSDEKSAISSVHFVMKIYIGWI